MNATEVALINHPHVKFYTDENGEYRWHVTAENGNILSDSGQGYNSVQGVLDGYQNNAKRVLITCGMNIAQVEMYLLQLSRTIATDLIQPVNETHCMYLAIRDKKG